MSLDSGRRQSQLSITSGIARNKFNRNKKEENDFDKLSRAGSNLGTYTEFYQAEYDRKQDFVAESLYRIHDKLTRGKERRKERI